MPPVDPSSGSLPSALTHTTPTASTLSRPALVVVSYLASAPFAPRGIRTRAVVSALSERCDVDLIAGPVSTGGGPSSTHAGRSLLRRTANFVHSSLLLDKHELWSRQQFRGWSPAAAGALLIGYPFSPLAYASRRLEALDIPYVVDIGDPWVLTLAGGEPATKNLARMRARVVERRMWEGASGAVVTTDRQAEALRSLFSRLPILVRPNGLTPLASDGPSPTDARVGTRLRLVHFGEIHAPRLDFGPFLNRLAQSGRWEAVEFHQYGSDWTGTLTNQRDVEVEFHTPREWVEVVAEAHRYDLAVVVGNRDPSTLPSKTVSYLQLPIPRLAVVGGVHDAVATYVADKPGWIVVDVDSDEAPAAVAAHLETRWSPAELAPPESELWQHVGDEIAAFVVRALFA